MASLTKKHCSDLNGKHILHTLTFFHFAISSSADQCDLKERGRATLRSTLAKRPRSRSNCTCPWRKYSNLIFSSLKIFPIIPTQVTEVNQNEESTKPKTVCAANSNSS